MNQPERQPLQFGIRSLLLAMVAVSLLFAVLRWLEVSATTSAIVLAILVIGVALAAGLIVAISAAMDDR